MESGQGSAAEEGQSAVSKKIADMDALLLEARGLVEGTDEIFERQGFTRKELSQIAMNTGIAALGAQMRKEEAAATAPKRKAKKKKAKRARVRL